MRKKGILASLLVALLTAGTACAAAAENEDLQSFELEPLVVTATRTTLTVKEAPSAVEVIDAKKLEQTQAKTLRDALRSALGVNVFNDFQGRSNVRIRGSESRHVLIMVDGKRLGGELSYNSANAWDVDRIRMEDVDRVEIIRGPAGALYGSDAMGGVINVITKVPERNAGSINYEYDWYENGKGAGYKANLYLQGAADKVSYKLNAGLNKNRPYMNGSSSDEYNFYGKEQPLSVNVGYTFDNGNKLSADFSRLKEDTQKSTTATTVMMPGRVWQDKTTTVINDNKRTDYALTYSGEDENQNWMLRAYRSEYNKHYKNPAHSVLYNMMSGKATITDDPGKDDTVKRTLSVIEGKDSWKLGSKNYMTAGFEYRQDKSEGTRLKKSASGSPNDAYDEASINYAAVYLQDEWRPDEKWLVIPSARYDYSDKFGSEITTRLASTYNAAKDVRVKAVVGQGYKTPTVNELYHYWEMFAQNPGTLGQFFEGNPDLEPEKSLSYELAVEKDFGKDSTVHLGIFREDVKDLITSYNTGRLTNNTTQPGLSGTDYIMSYRNVPKATLQGVELYGSYKIAKDIFLNAGYIFLDAKDKTSGTRLTDRAKHQVTFGVSYRPENKYAWDCSFDLVSNINYYYNNNEKATMGSEVYETKNFTIANIMTSKYITDTMKIYLGIDNISNHQNFGAYADGNLGRVYRLGLEYKF